MKAPPTEVKHNPMDGQTPFLWTHPRNHDLVSLIPKSPYYMKIATIIRSTPDHKDTIDECVENAHKVSHQVIVVDDTPHNKGIDYIEEDIEWVLFLDGDEIIDTELFGNFLNDPETYNHAMYHFASVGSVLIRKEFANMNTSISKIDDCRYQLHLCRYCSNFQSKSGYLYETEYNHQPLIRRVQ